MAEFDATPPRSVAVAVAILRRADGAVLLTERPASARYGGKWEFPGGKVESGETDLEALRRELIEELDVEVETATLLEQIETEYPDGGRFTVRFFVVEQWRGEPYCLASTRLAWVAPEELDRYEILDGSRDICALLLPSASSTSRDNSSRT